MKSIILAGGFAKRLWPLTKDIPKALIEIGGKPIIDYIIENIEDSEVEEIIISTNSKFEKEFKNWLKNKKINKKVRIIAEPSKKEEEKLGAIGGICYVLEKCKINEDCLIIAGDNLLGFKIKDFIGFYKEKKGVVNAIFDIKDVEKAKKFGIATIENGIIKDFIEKPENPPTTLASTGCYIFPKNDLPLFMKYIKEGNNKDAPGFFLQWLHKKQTVYAYCFSTNWFDIGNKEILENARDFFSK